jgi:hypothetical protein
MLALAPAVFLVLLLARKFGPAREVVKMMRELISRNAMSQCDGVGGKKADGPGSDAGYRGLRWCCWNLKSEARRAEVSRRE